MLPKGAYSAFVSLVLLTTQSLIGVEYVMLLFQRNPNNLLLPSLLLWVIMTLSVLCGSPVKGMAFPLSANSFLLDGMCAWTGFSSPEV